MGQRLGTEHGQMPVLELTSLMRNVFLSADGALVPQLLTPRG